MDSAHERGRIGGEVEVYLAGCEPSDKALFSERNGLHFRGARQGGEDHLCRLGYCSGIIRPNGARLGVRSGRLPSQIMDHELVARLDQVRGHVAPHGTKSDESNLHGFLSSKAFWVMRSPWGPFQTSGGRRG